jgi:hypothetical protein
VRADHLFCTPPAEVQAALLTCLSCAAGARADRRRLVRRHSWPGTRSRFSPFCSSVCPLTPLWFGPHRSLAGATSPVETPKTRRASCRVSAWRPKPNLSSANGDTNYSCLFLFFLSSCHQQLPRLEVAEPHTRM